MTETIGAPVSWRKAILSASTAIGLVATAASAGLTQLVAARVGYHPGLGDPVFIYGDTPIYWPWLWWQWMHAPWASYAKQTFDMVRSLLLLGAIGSAFGGLRWLAMRRRRPRSTPDIHGSARWATRADVERSGLIGVPEGRSIYLGEWTDEHGQRHALRDGGASHVAGIAPTRSGKGVSWVLPTLFTWFESLIVNDEKGELIAITRNWLQSKGVAVHRWQPGSSTRCEARYNFLDSIRVGTDYEVSDAQNIALMLVDTEGKGLDDKDPHWRKTAYSLLSGLCLFARLNDPKASLATVAAAISDPGKSITELFEEMTASDNLFVAQAGQIILSKPEKERGSVISTVATAVELFRDPVVIKNTSDSTFRIIDLVDADNPAALFLVTPGTDLLRLRALKRLLIAAIFRTLLSRELEFQGGQPLPPYKHKLLGVFDEFPSDGRQDIVEAAVPKCAGHGIRLMLIMQDREQLRAVYGQHESILANCHVRMALAPNSPDTAEWISRMTGETTIVQEAISESGKRVGAMTNVNRSIREVKRRLMTPDEVMRLPMTHDDEPGEMLIFAAGCPPIKATQTPYYLDPTFSERAAI